MTLTVNEMRRLGVWYDWLEIYGEARARPVKYFMNSTIELTVEQAFRIGLGKQKIGSGW